MSTHSKSEIVIPSGWKLVYTRDTIMDAVATVAAELDRDYAGKDLVLVAILSGAAYFMVDLSRALSIPHRVHYIQGSSYDGVQQGDVHIALLTNKDVSSMKDKHILLVDELYDNGKTLHEVARRITDEVPVASIKSCVTFRKRKEINTYAPPDYCGIDNIPDVWYVGYGLDDDGDKRSWLNLWGVPKPHGMALSPDDIALFK